MNPFKKILRPERDPDSLPDSDLQLARRAYRKANKTHDDELHHLASRLYAASQNGDDTDEIADEVRWHMDD